MTIIVQLKRKKLNGKISFWNESDPGYKKYAGSVYFSDYNYRGLLTHNGAIVVYRNNRCLGKFNPENFEYV